MHINVEIEIYFVRRRRCWIMIYSEESCFIRSCSSFRPSVRPSVRRLKYADRGIFWSYLFREIWAVGKQKIILVPATGRGEQSFDFTTKQIG